jgi:molecular chaperone GrpE
MTPQEKKIPDPKTQTTKSDPSEEKKEDSGIKANDENLEDQNNVQQDVADTDDPQTLKEKIITAETEAKENYDRYLRLAAEFENYKKRTSREKDEFRKYANESMIQELLSVADNLERAITSIKDDENASDLVLEGVDMTLKEILKVFEKFKVIPIKALGEPFDPAFHQAVMQEETDLQPENTVLSELQKGYMIHDRLLRPSMVVVSKSTANENDQ